MLIRCELLKIVQIERVTDNLQICVLQKFENVKHFNYGIMPFLHSFFKMFG